MLIFSLLTSRPCPGFHLTQGLKATRAPKGTEVQTFLKSMGTVWQNILELSML